MTYEKEHEKLWCEQRQINAAKREGRAVEIERQPPLSPEKQSEPAPSQRQPANDHLPNNVVMLARPYEQNFNAQEQASEQLDRQQRDHLKAEQRAEREAFFKDGATQFKATRHAVYDEVRKEYAPEWKQFYKDADAAQHSVEAWSNSAVTRATYFAKDGRWDEARTAFGDRDSVRDAVANEFAERKSDLKLRQTEDLRERQRDACDGLRDVRDGQYQELLQRQRDERSAFHAGQTLDGLGIGHEPGPRSERTVNTHGDAAANENRGNETLQPPPNPRIEAVAPTVSEQRQAETVISAVPVPDVIAPEPSNVILPTLEAPEVTRQLSDLAAGTIGSAASYLADQLGELFAPTPPEVREAQAKAAAKHEAEKPAPEEKLNPYARQIEAAMRIIEAEREQQKDRTYFEERDRDKGWERDQ